MFQNIYKYSSVLFKVSEYVLEYDLENYYYHFLYCYSNGLRKYTMSAHEPLNIQVDPETYGF